MDDSLPPVAADIDRQSRFITRSQGVMKMRWTTSRQDGSSHSDGKGDDNDGGDDDDEEDQDGDEDDEDGDEDEPPFYDSEIPGISNWDLLGEDFEREAAALGLYSSYELSIQLTTL